jgi:hypothetical protein
MIIKAALSKINPFRIFTYRKSLSKKTSVPDEANVPLFAPRENRLDTVLPRPKLGRMTHLFKRRIASKEPIPDVYSFKSEDMLPMQQSMGGEVETQRQIKNLRAEITKSNGNISKEKRVKLILTLNNMEKILKLLPNRYDVSQGYNYSFRIQHAINGNLEAIRTYIDGDGHKNEDDFNKIQQWVRERIDPGLRYIPNDDILKENFDGKQNIISKFKQVVTELDNIAQRSKQPQ